MNWTKIKLNLQKSSETEGIAAAILQASNSKEPQEHSDGIDSLPGRSMQEA
jgi:hypothetical protein